MTGIWSENRREIHAYIYSYSPIYVHIYDMHIYTTHLARDAEEEEIENTQSEWRFIQIIKMGKFAYNFEQSMRNWTMVANFNIFLDVCVCLCERAKVYVI